MLMLYLVILVVAVLLLMLPATRRVIRDPRALFSKVSSRVDRADVQRAGEAARSATGAAADAARSAADAARGAGSAMRSGQLDRQLHQLAQTLVIPAPLEQVSAVLTRAMTEAAVLDPAPPGAGEGLAWVYSALTQTRFAAEASPTGTTFGVVSFEYLDGSPQGASVAKRALDKARSELTAAGVVCHAVTRTFAPGPAVLDDGPRSAQPLPAQD